MTPMNDVSLEIQRVIQTANRCFFGLRKNPRSSHKTLIRPVLLYGSETWVLTKTICDPKIENGVYRMSYDNGLDKEFNSPNALNVTKTSRQKTRRATTKTLFRAKPNGRRKPRVNNDSLALGVRDWTHCA
jgi:hypothetical protein